MYGHGEIDRHVFLHVVETLHKFGGPKVEPAQVTFVEDLHGVFILLRVDCACRFVVDDGILVIMHG